MLLLALAALSLAQGHASDSAPAEDLYRLPADRYRIQEGTVTLLSGGAQISYVPGLGWLNEWPYPAPVVENGAVYVAEPVAQALNMARLGGVRFGVNGSELRAVVDLPGLARERISGLAGEGRLRQGEALELMLPSLLLPREPVEPYGGIDLTLEERAGALALRLAGPEMSYRVFALSDPTRLVLDLAPHEPLAPREERMEQLRAGLVYRRFSAMGRDGPSAVHLLEVAPHVGEFRVVGRSGEGRPVAEWADGALAAINAGYFNPSGFSAIGLRRIDGGLLALPSRGRAAVGFGPDGVTVARAAARVQVLIDGRVAVDQLVGAGRELELSRAGGAWFGDARHGLLLVDDGRVVGNTIGPRRVPEEGYALAYDPALRPLALVEPGAQLEVRAQLLPDGLERSRWAVEAGPLLVQDGRAAFDPDVEQFARGQRILDAVTQQAVFGVRADGTALMVVAERMTAQDLVPLMLQLGAEHALRLDSGSSATLFADDRVLNRLFQRSVSDAIVLVPSGGDAARAAGE